MKISRLMAWLCRSTTLAGILSCGVGMSGSAFADSLIVNGSFEQGPFAGSFVNLAGGTTSITGWVVTGQGIDYIGSLWASSEGNHSLDLDGSVGSAITPPFVHGGVAQTFVTTPGTNYDVTFDMAGNVFAGPTIKPMQVSAAGQAANFTFDITGKNASAMGWTSKSWTFTANDVSTTLEFSSLTVSPFTGWGPALDNVSVLAQGSPPPASVPEPGTVSLLGLGLVALVVTRRRKAD